MRPAEHGAEEGDFQNDDFGFAKGACGAREDLKLRALDVNFDEKRTGEIFFSSELINSETGTVLGEPSTWALRFPSENLNRLCRDAH